ncbi:MAG: TIGR00282 family metallophosphoesterase [Dehalococcoidia bacterium]|nr:TIGR00282 family metallophosphoesterase [Dehalococcoidia bacterium]
MHILAIGDVIGRPGRNALKTVLPQLKSELGVDFTIVNGENSAGGIGITPDTAQEMLDCGVDVLTTGNHVWAQKEIIPCLDTAMPLLRPLNFPAGVPGRGHLEKDGVTVVNLLGQTFIGNFECPFRTMDRLLESMDHGPHIIIIDFHAEATSEKVALGRYLDGRVTAVLGTHTHVGTIDAGLLPKGTAYVTDIGMTGPMDSVIGDDVDVVIRKFLTKMPYRLSVGKGKNVVNGILLDVDTASGKALGIQRVQRIVD